MNRIVLLIFTLNIFLFSADFPLMNQPKAYRKFQSINKYKQIDKELTLSCDCGEPAELLPYNGEDIPLAQTEACLSSGCIKVFFSSENF